MNDLKTLADRYAEQATGDFDAVLRTATARRRGLGAAAAMACAVLVVAAVVSWPAPESAPPPVVSTPTLDPAFKDSMTITPATAAPGAAIDVTFPSENVRGLDYSLSRPGGKQIYGLAAAYGENKPTWGLVGDPGSSAWVEPGVHGAGPDHLILPDTIPDGTYLLCTVTVEPLKACALLTIAR